VWLKEIARNEVRQELRRRMRDDRRLEMYQTHALQTYDVSSDSIANDRLELALQKCTDQLPTASAENFRVKAEHSKSRVKNVSKASAMSETVDLVFVVCLIQGLMRR
jgi:hypothetical protein